MVSDTVRQRLQERSDEELLEIVRLHDTDEWQTEVFALAESILQARGVANANELVPASEDNNDPRDDSPVVIAWFTTVVESEACRSALISAGFTVASSDESVLRIDPALGPALGGCKLVVPVSEADEALEFLAAAESGALAEGLLVCAQCGSTNVVAKRTVNRQGTLVNAFLVGPAIQDIEISYNCRACGAPWQ